jgi:hypothetical protein
MPLHIVLPRDRFASTFQDARGRRHLCTVLAVQEWDYRPQLVFLQQSPPAKIQVEICFRCTKSKNQTSLVPFGTPGGVYYMCAECVIYEFSRYKAIPNNSCGGVTSKTDSFVKEDVRPLNEAAHTRKRKADGSEEDKTSTLFRTDHVEPGEERHSKKAKEHREDE